MDSDCNNTVMVTNFLTRLSETRSLGSMFPYNPPCVPKTYVRVPLQNASCSRAEPHHAVILSVLMTFRQPRGDVSPAINFWTIAVEITLDQALTSRIRNLGKV